MPIRNCLTPTKDLPCIVEGDSVSIPVEFDEPSGTPIDISGWRVTLSIADIGTDTPPIIQKTTTTHEDPAQGMTIFALSPSDTSGIMGSKRYDIEFEMADGTVRTAVIGRVDFLDGVTDTV